MTNKLKIYTPLEAEEILGKKYFYRQRIYRLAEKYNPPSLSSKDSSRYAENHIIAMFIKELKYKIISRFPELGTEDLAIYYDNIKGKRIVVDGLFGRSVSVQTDEENQEDMLKKIDAVVEWLGKDVDEDFEIDVIEEGISKSTENKPISLSNPLPEEILWVRVDTKTIKDIDVKSYILISLPSIAQFIGIRTDQFTEWIAQKSFSEFILSAHHKQIHGTEISVSWKKGITKGLVPLIPFELVPEVIVAFRQSKRSKDVKYPEKAELLYELSKSTLEAVGLAVSGNRDQAARELAKVGEGLGLTVAEQIIGVFRQYESREFQIKTNKEFRSKIKSIGGDFSTTIGSLTLGVTGRYPTQWKTYGMLQNLPKTVSKSSREVMRRLSPADGIGMTFGERHYIKDPNMNEAIETGRQGKSFYERLKNVGLLEDELKK